MHIMDISATDTDAKRSLCLKEYPHHKMIYSQQEAPDVIALSYSSRCCSEERKKTFYLGFVSLCVSIVQGYQWLVLLMSCHPVSSLSSNLIHFPASSSPPFCPQPHHHCRHIPFVVHFNLGGDGFTCVKIHIITIASG